MSSRLPPDLDAGAELAPDDDLPRLREPSELRARPTAIALLFLWELAWGFVVASPVHGWAAYAWGGHPEGDAVLFHPGARELMMWLGAEGATLPVVLRTLLLLLFVGILASPIVLGAALASLAWKVDARDGARRALRTGEALRAGLTSFFPFAVVLVLCGALELVVVGAGVLGAGALGRAFAGQLGDQGAFGLEVSTVALAAALAAAVGIGADLARAAIARHRSPSRAAGRAWPLVRDGLLDALTVLRARPLAALGGWGGRALAGAALVGAGSFVATSLGGRGGGALVALALVHQAIVLARAGLRAGWLAAALRLIPAPPQP